MSYYEIITGSGFYWCNRHIIKTDYPTTDYGALIDVLIDYLVEKKDNNILDMNEYKWDSEGNNIIDKDGRIIYPDEFIQGGNCGDVLMHYGEFRINEISENEINDAVVIEI